MFAASRYIISGLRMKYSSFCLALLLMLASVSSAQPEQNLGAVFEAAAAEFNIPPAILKGIAFAETRWAHIRPNESFDAERHMPPAYGVMALRNDDWFGRSLIEAARLINADVSHVKQDVGTNIRAGAAYIAYLASLQAPPPVADDLLSWFHVVAQYPGIPQQDIKGSYAEQVFIALHDGYDAYGITIRPEYFDLNRMQAIYRQHYPPAGGDSPSSEDYGPAEWDPSPNFSSRAGTPISHVIVHDTEGSFAGAVSWLKNPASQASAHYIFRSNDGFLKQLVREADKAWHVRCWNDWTIGIEHEGYVNNPAWFTPIMYQNSALLSRHLTARYGLARNRLRIVGHNVWQISTVFSQLNWSSCNDHTDPGSFWNWDYYLSLIVSDSTPPAVTTFSPNRNQANVPVYKNIVIKFDKPMDIFSTQSAFTIFPDAPGRFIWSQDSKTLTYDPNSNLTNNESYLVSLSQSAKSAGGGRLTEAVQFVFTTSALDTVGPRVTQSYPPNGATEINPGVAFQIRFDEPVVFSTFSGRVRLVDVADSNTFIGIGSVSYVDVDDKGLLTFAPSADLQLGRTYRLRFLPGLRDPLNNSSSFESRIEFTIRQSPVVQGSIFDWFENNAGQWQQPKSVPGSMKIDTLATSFAISSTFKRTGTFSGRLIYSFSDTVGGVCRLMTAAPAAVSPANGWVGLWVFGDNSGNALEFWFNNVTGGNVIAEAGPLNWFGWKFVTVPITASMSAFNSVVVRQVHNVDQSGTIYIDDAQVQISTGVVDRGTGGYQSFRLHQNYPNPFNPATRIAFDLDRPEFVTLSVFNTLGQKVATIVNRELEGGHHEVEFAGLGVDGKHLPSGVYLYRLQTSAGVAVKKMMLMK